MAETEPCPGCGADLAPVEGPAHAYIGASPACWARYGELLARTYEQPTWFHTLQDAVDAYAVQHPGLDGRRQRQSVAVHLVALCLTLEHGWSPDRLPAARRQLIDAIDDFPWLEPPAPDPNEVRITDVVQATSADTHAALTRRWAASVWDRWSPHHDTVHGWVARAG